ncbi:MAG: magnesium chelatase subunit D [Pseudomonadota bacterium]
MTPWDSATTALQLLALDPALGGMVIRSRAGPVRDALMRAAEVLPLLPERLHPAMQAEALDGGIDLASTLSSGKLRQRHGLLTRGPRTLTLTMAERAEPHLAARLARALDEAGGHVLLALDEGVEDEAVSERLSDRLAFRADLSLVALSDVGQIPSVPKTTAHRVHLPEDLPAQLVILAAKLGITSLRAVGLTLRAARAHARLNRRRKATEADVTAAVALVMAHRATQLPQEDEAPPEVPEDAQDAERDETQNPPDPRSEVPDELLLEAVKAALPADLLAQLQNPTTARGASGAGSGARHTGNRKGRPLPARSGTGGTDARVDLIATLRNAVPWQTIRKAAQPGRNGALIRPEDLARKRYESHSDRLLIFAVDASGSAALARLGEAKGAVELLLAQAYARRDHVALIGFRGQKAELLLPPTRSLVQTKRRLADLPGGGATPLAAGLSAALVEAQQARRKGLTPTLVLLTDGRCNVALDGSADRAQAAADAQAQAQALRLAGVESIVIDTANRPSNALKTLSTALGAHYLPLPRADAAKLSEAISAQLDA